MNDLYRKGAKYGDGSSAFLVLLEQFRGGAGKDPTPIVGASKHLDKVNDLLESLREIAEDENLIPEARQKIQQEIDKITSAIKWAEDFKNGKNPKLPSWATEWSDQFE